MVTDLGGHSPIFWRLSFDLYTPIFIYIYIHKEIKLCQELITGHSFAENSLLDQELSIYA